MTGDPRPVRRDPPLLPLCALCVLCVQGIRQLSVVSCQFTRDGVQTVSTVREIGGVSFQLAGPRSTASWKLTPRLSLLRFSTLGLAACGAHSVPLGDRPQPIFTGVDRSGTDGRHLSNVLRDRRSSSEILGDDPRPGRPFVQRGRIVRGTEGRGR